LPNSELLNAGNVSGVFGVKGWIKVFSFTHPRENLLNYSPWLLRKNNQTREYKVLTGKCHGNAVIVELEGITDRDAAFDLMGSEILIRKDKLPKPEADEYYWTDLIGLNVVTETGVNLGTVDHLLETGANDVLVVNDGTTERLIPFLQQQTVLKIDLIGRLIIVDWDPDF
jgi:16S rRNA processing protein RimM